MQGRALVIGQALLQGSQRRLQVLYILPLDGRHANAELRRVDPCFVDALPSRRDQVGEFKALVDSVCRVRRVVGAAVLEELGGRVSPACRSQVSDQGRVLSRRTRSVSGAKVSGKKCVPERGAGTDDEEETETKTKYGMHAVNGLAVAKMHLFIMVCVYREEMDGNCVNGGKEIYERALAHAADQSSRPNQTAHMSRKSGLACGAGPSATHGRQANRACSCLRVSDIPPRSRYPEIGRVPVSVNPPEASPHQGRAGAVVSTSAVVLECPPPSSVVV